MTNVNYDLLIKWLLPVRLRTASIVAFLLALTAPIRLTLYPRFKVFERRAWSDLKYQSGQVAHLEFVLNERFDNVNTSIFIGPGYLADDRLYIYTDAENVPLHIYTEPELLPMYLYTDLEFQSGMGGYDFVVHLPSYLAYKESQIRAVVDRYKRDGKSYIIQYF